jgi:hypothetical protein
MASLPHGRNVQVENPEKYRYDPNKLLSSMGELVARLSTSPVFVAEVAQEADYDAPTMQKAHDALAKDNQIDYEIVARLGGLMKKVRRV